MTIKVRLYAIVSVAIIVVLTWALIANFKHVDVQEQPQKNFPKDDVTFNAKSTSEQPPSVSALSIREETIVPALSQDELDAMSLEEYVDHMDRMLEELPSDAQAEVYKQRAIAAKRWKEVGVFTEEEQQSYQSYDKQTLESLGNQGDLLALDVLAQKYLLEDKNLAKSRETNLKAVLFGSAKAAGSLAIKPSSDDRSEIYKSMAWHQVAAMLGDKSAPAFGYSVLKAKGITLDEQEWVLVQRQAEDAYALLNAKRRELGLPDYQIHE